MLVTYHPARPDHVDTKFSTEAFSSFYGQDPFVTYDSVRSLYYLLQSVNHDTQIALWASMSLNNLGQGTPVNLFTPTLENATCSVWAPEMHLVNGEWYFYYAACDGRNFNHRMYCARISDPLSEDWHELGKICDPDDDCWGIDQTILRHAGKLYTIWSGWDDPSATEDFYPQNLYIAEMINPWTVKPGTKVVISKPEYEWEGVKDHPINEGPQVLLNNGHTLVVYSANASWKAQYTQGLIKLIGKDPLNPSHWQKLPDPIFGLNVGHPSFLEDLVFYHYKSLPNVPGWKDRVVACREFSWTNELPVFTS